MKAAFVIFIVFLLPTWTFAQNKARNDFRCLASLQKNLAPYVNLPEYRGAFEHYQIYKETVGRSDVMFWDAPPLEGADLRTRHIFTSSGAYQCHYPKNMDPSDLAFSKEKLESGSPDILTKKGFFKLFSGITCRKADFDAPKALLDLYISWSPQLYHELLMDKTSSSDFDKVSGNYTPKQFNYSTFSDCKTIAGPYDGDIRRKAARFTSTWNSVVGQGSVPFGGSSSGSAGGTQ